MRRLSSMWLVCALLLVFVAPSLAAKGGKPGGGGGGAGGGGGGEPPADPAIAYVDHTGNGGNQLWVMDADGSNATQLTGSSGGGVYDSAMNPSWMSDGARILFEGNMQGNGIYVVDRDGANLQKLHGLNNRAPLPAHAHPAHSPVPTPDGSHRIVFCDLEAGYDTSNAEADVYVMNPDGTGVRRLIETSDAYEYDVSWAPAGDRLVVHTIRYQGAPARLLVYDLTVAGGLLTATFSHGLIDVAGSPLQGNVQYFASPSWARTRDEVAIAATTVEGTRDIWVIDVGDPTDAVRVTTHSGALANEPDWAPDDSRLVFNDDGRIMSIRPDGTELTRLAGKNRGDDLSQPAWRP